jgi:hypothetical protein
LEKNYSRIFFSWKIRATLYCSFFTEWRKNVNGNAKEIVKANKIKNCLVKNWTAIKIIVKRRLTISSRKRQIPITSVCIIRKKSNFFFERKSFSLIFVEVNYFLSILRTFRPIETSFLLTHNDRMLQNSTLLHYEVHFFIIL